MISALDFVENLFRQQRNRDFTNTKDITVRLERVNSVFPQHVEVQAIQCKNKGASVWQQCHVDLGVERQVDVFWPDKIKNLEL